MLPAPAHAPLLTCSMQHAAWPATLAVCHACMIAGVFTPHPWPCARQHQPHAPPHVPHCPTQSNKPLQKFKRKAVYFVKSEAARLENDNIGKTVRILGCCHSARAPWRETLPLLAVLRWLTLPSTLPHGATIHPLPHSGPYQLLHGELTEAPLETLSAVASSVFLPLLSSAHNREGWPDVVAREVTESLHKFVGNGEEPASGGICRKLVKMCSSPAARPGDDGTVRAACKLAHVPNISISSPFLTFTVKASIGESKGQTVLPLPVADTSSLAAAAAPAAVPSAAQDAEALKLWRPGHLAPDDAEKVHILEAAVLTWTKQIKNVLQADPDAPLKVKGVPG